MLYEYDGAPFLPVTLMIPSLAPLQDILSCAVMLIPGMARTVTVVPDETVPQVPVPLTVIVRVTEADFLSLVPKV